MTVILSLDPGLAVEGGTGAVLWREKQLVAAGLFTAKGTLEERIADLHSQGENFVGHLHLFADLVVIEKMKVYKRQKGDPEDLIDLSILGGRLSALGLDCRFVEPSAWKGQVPKHVVKRLVEKELTVGETEVLAAALKGIAAGKRHNVFDAVGIGLHALERWPK